MSQAPAPFAIQYSPNVPELLTQLKCTLALSTYQAGKLVFLSAKDENTLVQLPRNFLKPMGIAEHATKDKLAVACKDEVVVFANSPDLAHHYPKQPKKYDALYMPRCTYHTAGLDIHDLRYGGDKLYAVNTLFSCIVELDDDYNFRPYWQPPFIDKLVSEDRCHLNGMAMRDGKPIYASAFNTGNTPRSWKENITTTGVIMDMESNEQVARGLAMPHSPRIFNEQLFVLLSATGELVRVDIANGKYDPVCKIGGFVRGMSICEDYLFVGINKLRKNSSTFAKLPFADAADKAGIVIVHLPTGSIAGQIIYRSSVDEIYDVHVLKNKLRPNILNTMTDDHKMGVMIPDTTYWGRKDQT